MKLKKWLTLALAGALLISGIVTANAAELDVAWYAAKNPDVVAVFGNSPEMLKLHYDMFGRKEARMANTHDVEAQLRKMFNPTEYATLYPDVKAAFGENAEAMFQHYMAFGLLESRRPSEKVSKETAANLKKAVEKALASAGIPALPGSAQLVAVLTGEIKADVVGGAAVQQALMQVASVVEKAVVETVQKVNNPSSGGGGGSSSGDSSSGCGGSGSSGSGSGAVPPGSTGPQYTYTVSANNPLYVRKTASGDYEKLTNNNAGEYFNVVETVSGNELEAVSTYSYVELEELTTEASLGYVQKNSDPSIEIIGEVYYGEAANITKDDFTVSTNDIIRVKDETTRQSKFKDLYKDDGALIDMNDDTSIVAYFDVKRSDQTISEMSTSKKGYKLTEITDSNLSAATIALNADKNDVVQSDTSKKLFKKTGGYAPAVLRDCFKVVAGTVALKDSNNKLYDSDGKKIVLAQNFELNSSDNVVVSTGAVKMYKAIPVSVSTYAEIANYVTVAKKK